MTVKMNLRSISPSLGLAFEGLRVGGMRAGKVYATRIRSELSIR